MNFIFFNPDFFVYITFTQSLFETAANRAIIRWFKIIDFYVDSPSTFPTFSTIMSIFPTDDMFCLLLKKSVLQCFCTYGEAQELRSTSTALTHKNQGALGYELYFN